MYDVTTLVYSVDRLVSGHGYNAAGGQRAGYAAGHPHGRPAAAAPAHARVRRLLRTAHRVLA